MLEELLKALAPERQLQVTVWDPEDDSVEHSFSSFVMSKVGALFMIAPPDMQAEKIVPLLQKDVLVGVVFELYPNSYILYPVVHALPADDKKGYWLKILPDTQMELVPMDVVQRRKHVRINMQIPFELEYCLGGQNMPRKVKAFTENVSGGGLKFNSSVMFPVGQELTLYIQFNATLPLLSLKGKVVMCASNRSSKGVDDLYSTSCQFIEMDDAREMIVVRECFRRELKHKD